jgi:2-dehydropantoate 2-reductase
MNVGVIGVGGVGGYFGGKLTKLSEKMVNQDLRIFFIARNKHLEEIKSKGLMLSTVDEGEFFCKPTLATDNFDDLPELDICLVCVKVFDLNNVLKAVESKIKNKTFIIPLLNGVDIYERIRKIIAKGILYPSCVYVGTHVERPGKITQNGGSCTILFGQDPQYPDVSPERVLELFSDANIKYKWCDDPYQEIWSKYIFISAFGMVTASENKTIGQIFESKELSNTVKSIMAEIVEVAGKKGVKLPLNIIEDSFQKGKNFPYETKTSFQRDFEQKDKFDERDLFGNTIIRLGQANDVETPITKLVNDKLNKMKKEK